MGDIDQEAGLVQPLADESGRLAVVLHEQDSHGASTERVSQSSSLPMLCSPNSTANAYCDGTISARVLKKHSGFLQESFRPHFIYSIWRSLLNPSSTRR